MSIFVYRFVCSDQVRNVIFRYARRCSLQHFSTFFERVELLVELVELVRVELVRVLVVPVVFCSSSRCSNVNFC